MDATRHEKGANKFHVTLFKASKWENYVFIHSNYNLHDFISII